MSVWTSTPTQKGLALQGKLLSTDKLDITRVVSGTGSVPVGQLSAQTAISDIKQELTVEYLTYDENGIGHLGVLINNYTLQTGYSMKQIGIYANDPDEGEILYIIAQVTDVAEKIPSISEQPAGFTLGWTFLLTFSNSSNISITITPDAFITSKAADLRFSAKDHSHSEYPKKEDLAGRIVAGKTVPVDRNNTAVAGNGAEIFNDYREPSFDASTDLLLQGNVASGSYSHAEGSSNVASGSCSHAEGSINVASNFGSHAEGLYSSASGYGSHAEGAANLASGYGSHAEGNDTKATGSASHAEGRSTIAEGDYSHAGGYQNTAKRNQTVFGKFADTAGSADKGDVASESATTGSLFVIGNGTSDTARANVFRASASGRCYGSQAFGSSGADYAEFFEWLDGNPDNEDRRGMFVTLDGEYIRIATDKDDFILGVISATPSIVGDVHSESWKDMYLRDVFGERITEVVTVPETVDEIAGKTIPEHTETRWILNPDYDKSKGYLSRDERQEWAAVGLMGKLIVIDDGTCQVNGYCTVDENGKATAVTDDDYTAWQKWWLNFNPTNFITRLLKRIFFKQTGYRVMKRIDDTHIKIFFR